MTIFAGAFSLIENNFISNEIKNEFKKNLRSIDDTRGVYSTFDQQKIFLIKWDSNAFNESAWKINGDSMVSTLVGDPLLLTQAGMRMDRGSQLSLLAQSNGLNINALAQTRGAFSIIQYEGISHTLRLSTDMIGLRSVYYTVQDGIFFFSSALRILEVMPSIGKKLSINGMLELSMFAFPLAERTPYEGIFLLRECELLTVTAAGIQSSAYYDWTSTELPPSQPQEAAEALFAKFQEAIRIRIGSDATAYAFLSGGMDSRAIVSALLMEGRSVDALNFSPDDSQDQAYARSFAKAAGSKCYLHSVTRDHSLNFSLLAYHSKNTLEKMTPTMVDRPEFMWSGDGGSVGLGHVYMDEAMLEFTDKGDIKTAFSHFLSFNRLALPEKIFSKEARKKVLPKIFSNALLELNRYPRKDLGRRLYLFLLFNDQRRHLFNHFESIDQHGLEFLLPFYDVPFLKMVADTPVQWGILHHLYAQWFECFPAFTRSTPWQTYPGHQACPVAGDSRLSYQWASRAYPVKPPFASRVKVARALLSQACSRDLDAIFSRPRLVLAALVHGLGLRDCEHILAMLHVFRKQAAKAV